MTDAYELFKVPAGTAVSEVETGDPLVRRFQFVQPDATIRTLELGPNGVTVIEISVSPDCRFEIDVSRPI